MSKKNKANHKELLGVDLVDNMPDYFKTPEENEKIYRERFKKVYGRYPENMKE